MHSNLNHGRIFGIGNDDEFRVMALEIFHYQAEAIPVYKEFIRHLRINPGRINEISKIPFLPVEFFKSHEIIVPGKISQIVFESSRTTGTIPSKHFVADPGLYRRSIRESFSRFYGKPEHFCFIALLPSYLERPGSSLLYMAENLIKSSQDEDSGFYREGTEKLIRILERKNAAGTPVILLGVSFALAELAEKFQLKLPGIIFMETGGMKGRRKEIIREELHELIRNSFQVTQVHSEYGMTELLSQAYSQADGKFKSPPWMKILVRDIHDHEKILKPHETGALNIIDLANIYSCSFLTTSDIGRLHPDGCFEVLGRTDHSDLRGCNLLVADE